MDHVAQLEELLESGLVSQSRLADFQRNVTERTRSTQGIEAIRSRGLVRLVQALRNFDLNGRESGVVGTSDLVVLLRNVIRLYERSLAVPASLWELLRERASLAGLYTSVESTTTVTVHTTTWRPNWLLGAKEGFSDRLEHRRTFVPALGDGLIAAMTAQRFVAYQSEGQKRAVDAVLSAPTGSTTLITLPTGGGKSFCVSLPSWFTSQGGTRKGGTTIVVVPTVSLAIDQYRQAMEFFAARAGPTFQPQCLVGDTPAEVRANIYQGFEDGTLPLLFTSPEALLNGRVLYEKALSAARNRTLNWLVIDEAHIVESWGADFRTEFQLLSAYRRKLLEASGGQLRTLLLSATVSAACADTLRLLFAENGNWQTVQANQLRPEIAFWFHIASDEDVRRQRVLETLYHLPRPAILYVTQPEQVSDWVRLLNESGFNRLAGYSGVTVASERRAIMREWDRDERDLIIATSAFGLGVDKKDVRAIVHATATESVDRFYQEVGRAGRDGYSAISLTCVTEDDFKLAKSLVKQSHITAEKAWGRWHAMWLKSEALSGDERVVDLDTAPTYNQEIDTSDRHRAWNEHVLLLMQRARMLSIKDTPPPQTQDEAPGDAGDFEPRRQVLVQVLAHNAVTDPDQFKALLRPHRDTERHAVAKAAERLREMVERFSVMDESGATRCLALALEQLYPVTARACGGCPYCRLHGYEPYARPIHVDTELLPPADTYTGYLSPWLNRVIRNGDHLIVTWRGPEHLASLGNLAELLLDGGFSQIVIPGNEWEGGVMPELLVTALAKHSQKTQRLLTTQHLAEGYQWQHAPSLVIFPTDEASADKLYQALQPVPLSNVPIVYVVDSKLYLHSLGGRFLDRVDGITWEIQKLVNRLTELRRTL